MIHLDAYLRRIRYDGPREPSLAVLEAICLAHPAAILFENIDPLVGRPPLLSPVALHAKLVERRRGGYCFEQNALLRDALGALGMQVTQLSGRVVWMAAPDAPARPRSHMLLKIELPDAPHESFIADVGFGGCIYNAPLRLQLDVPQRTPAGRHRISSSAGTYAVEAELPGGWMPMYRFTLEPHLPVDYEPLNWFTATHPSSIFCHNLLMERLTPEWRANLLNDRLILRATGAEPQTRRIDSADEFAQVLDAVFDVEPPIAAAQLFERLPKCLDGAFVPAPPEPATGP